MTSAKIIVSIICLIMSSMKPLCQSTPIPDSNFELYLINLGIDSQGIANGSILNSDAEAVTNLSILNPLILDITGLEAFKNLEDLYISSYAGSSCPIYTMDSLKKLTIIGSGISNLNLSQNTILQELTIQSSPLTNVDLSQNTLLKSLDLKSVEISDLDINNNVLLETVALGSFLCDTLDFSNNLNLTHLGIAFLGLDYIDITNNTALSILTYRDSATEIDLSQNVNLEQVNLEQNMFSEIDLSQNNAIEQLYIGNNQLDSVNVANLANLKRFRCDSNYIDRLDLRFNPLLEYLDCRTNNLSELNIKNGNNSNVSTANFNATANPNLFCIEVDNASYSNNTWTGIDSQSFFTTNCGYDLGIKNESKSRISIYPNPTNSHIQIQSNTLPKIIRITSLSGTTVYESNFKSEYNISHLSKGLYLVIIETDEGCLVKKLQVY
jgi:hypothetical protein